MYRASIALVIVGFLVSTYMTIYKLTSNDTMCLGSGDCHTVNASSYSVVNGIPVAVVGMFGYATLLGTLLLEKRNAYFMKYGTLLFFGMSLTGFLLTVWLIFVEIVLIKAYCPFCITSQVAMTLIFILSVIRLIRQP